jgi:serine/threonine-protein kinase
MVGELIADRYDVQEIVATGGMSTVYRARDRLLERYVALKVLHDSHLADADTIERFRHEAQAVAQLSHPNIVTVIDRGESDGRLFIVLEYVEGEDLKTLLERHGRLPVRRTLELAIEIGQALAFAHGRGVVHRDVKPQNVLLNRDGIPKVTDFGIARSAAVEGLTQTGTILGTSDYIAPEQASGAQAGPRADVYSLGVVLFELLTGATPFDGDTFVAIALRHVQDPVPSVLERRPDVPLRVARAVERALRKDPAERSSMDELVAELQACLAELDSDAAADETMVAPSPMRRTNAPHRGRAGRRLTPLVALSGGLVAIAAIAIGAVTSTPDGTLPILADEAPAQAQPLRLLGVASYDPQGDDRVEHEEAVGLATDGDLSTHWKTETYEDFSALKDGVGLVLDAGRPVGPAELIVQSSTPGFTARIDAGARADGPFEPVSAERTVQSRTTFELEDTESRYFVVWITDLPEGVARLTEVKAR